MALLHTGGWGFGAAKDPLGATGFDPTFWPNEIALDLGLARKVVPPDLVRWMPGKPMQFKLDSLSETSNFGYELVETLIDPLAGVRYEFACKQPLAKANITRMQLAGSKRSDRRHSEVVYYLHPLMTPARVREQAEPIPFDFDVPYTSLAPQEDWMAITDGSHGWLTSAIDYARLVSALDRNPAYPPPPRPTATCFGEHSVLHLHADLAALRKGVAAILKNERQKLLLRPCFRSCARLSCVQRTP